MTLQRMPLARLLASALLALGLSAQAAGLQVSPVSLTLAASQQADGLWLTNTGAEAMQVQVRVFGWSQAAEAGDQLTPSTALQVSPPMLSLAPGARQLVRVLRVGAAPAGPEEQAFRLIVDELPVEQPEGPASAPAPARSGTGGLTYVLRHSLPVFLLPAGAAPSAPQLAWSLATAQGKAVLQAENRGGTHAQISRVRFTPTGGQTIEVNPGLMGYVLPGAVMRWPLAPPMANLRGTGQWQLDINGKTEQPNIAPLERSAR